jgi:hypothetical protein
MSAHFEKINLDFIKKSIWILYYDKSFVSLQTI